MNKLLVCALSLGIAACSDTEDRRLSLVDNPRILAIAASPPVVAAGETSELSALVVDGNGPIDDTQVAWRACAPWSVVVDPAAQCGADASMPLPGGVLQAPGALDEAIELSVVAQVTIGGVDVVAVKRIRIVPDVPDPRPMLTLEGFHLDGDTSPAVEALRTYQAGVDVSGMFSEAAEVRVNFYATGGEFDDESTDAEIDPADPVVPVSTSWTAPDQPGGLYLWFVATGPDNTTTWLEVTPEE